MKKKKIFLTQELSRHYAGARIESVSLKNARRCARKLGLKVVGVIE